MRKEGAFHNSIFGTKAAMAYLPFDAKQAIDS
jgi:hypothetical protein